MYDGYSWSKLPTIGAVTLSVGKTLQEEWVGSGQLICVDSITICAQCSDGIVFRSPVCMAVKPWAGAGERTWYGDCEVYVTAEAQRRLSNCQIWYHLGGYDEDGDSYDTQERDFDEQLDAFWLRLAGPDEPLRDKLMNSLSGLKHDWHSVTILPEGRVTIRLTDGKDKTLLPPKTD